jgi:ABC-type phosphate transport system substrate-binding protein
MSMLGRLTRSSSAPSRETPDSWRGAHRSSVRTRAAVHSRLAAALCLAVGLAGLLAGCGGKKEAAVEKTTIQVKGSDTMVNVAQAWAEAYRTVAPAVEIEVSGGGSGVGIAALEKGTIDIANSSRNMKPEEMEQAKRNTSKDVKEFIVAYDALGVYVHKDNPIEEITFEQLAQIFKEGRNGQELVAARREDPRRHRRRDRAGEPPIQLGNLRVLP